MAQITNQMSTNLTLDIGSAQRSLKELTATVKDSTSEWKVQEAQLRAAGDAVGSSKAKYEGLQHTLDAQKSKVEQLKQAIENNNTTTKKGQDLQTYLTNELAKAERQMASYTGQIDKAKQAYQYQESGLAKLNQEVKHANDLTDARVQKLEAEGNKEEANKVKLSNLKNAQENYTKQLEIQKNELNKLAESSDKSSDSYKRQELRVEQMGAKLARTQSEIKSFNHTEIKPNTSGMTRVEGSLKSLDSKLEGTRGHFKSIFMGNLIASGVSNALGSIKSHLTGVIQAGIDYNKQMQNVQIGLDNFTGGNKELSGKLLENIKGVKEESGYATDTVSLLTKKTYGLTKNTDGAKKLSDAFVNLGRATGMNDGKLTGLITKFSQANASGEITTGSLTKLNKQLPGFSDALAKSVNVSKDKLSGLASSGKLSMQDLAKAIETMSNSKPHGLDNYYKTFDGFTNHFEERYKSLSGKITQGFFSQSNNMLAGLSKSLDGKKVDKAFSRIGSSANEAVNTVAKAFSSTFKGSKTNPIADMANFTADTIQKLGNFVAKHAKDIKSFFEMVKNLGSTGFGTMKTTLKIALPLLESLGKFAAKHPTTFKVLAGSIIAFNLALKGTLATIKLFGNAKKAFIGVRDGAKLAGSGIKAAFNFAKANPLLLIITAVVAVGAALYELYKHNKKFRTFVNGLIKGVQNFFKGVSKWMGKVWSSIKGVVKSVIKIFKKNWKEILLLIVNPFAGAFSLIYKHNKKFRNAINGLVKSVKNFFTGMWKSVRSIFNHLVNDLKHSLDWFKKVWRNSLNFISDFIGDTWNGIKKNVTGIASRLWNSLKDSINDFFGSFKRTWNNLKNFFGDTWNGIKGIGSRAINSLKDTLGGCLGKIGKSFGDTWNGVKTGFGKFWDGMKQMASDGLNAVISPINSGINGINSLIRDFGGSKHAIGNIPRVRFANGTGAIDRLTHAVLNDGNDSPETGNKETLIHPNGKMEVVQGRNTQRLLLPGTEVLNASETKMLMAMQGVRHFADGTGFFGGLWKGIKGVGSKVTDVAGDVWNGMKDGVKKFTKMFKFITDAVAHPIKTLEGVFNPKNGGLTGAIGDITGGFIKKAKNQAKDWWSELWSMANDASEAGSSAGNKGDDYLFKNKGADAGTDPWGYYFRECVSFVASRLKNMGVSPRLFTGLGNGSDWVNAKVKHTKNPKPGDVAVYAAGSDYGNHVAMVSSVQGGKISGEEYNFLPSASHKYHTYTGRPISGATTFLDFGKSVASKVKDVASNSGLAKLIKKQTGGMMSWIQKYIAPLNDSDGTPGNTALPKGSHKNWLKQAGAKGDFSKWNYIINHESGWNPKAKNPGSDAYGIGQALPPSKMAKFGGDYMSNPITQLKWMKSYVNERYGGIDGAYDFWKAHHWYANGGLVTKHQIAEIGEGNKPEMIIPLDGLKSSRGYELLGKTMSVMAARDNLASQSTNVDGLEKLESKFDSMIQLLGQLVKGQANPTPAYVIANQASQEINKVNNNGSRLTRNAMG